MNERGFSHSPSALPIREDDIYQLAERPVFFIEDTLANEDFTTTPYSDNEKKQTKSQQSQNEQNTISKVLKKLGFK